LVLGVKGGLKKTLGCVWKKPKAKKKNKEKKDKREYAKLEERKGGANPLKFGSGDHKGDNGRGVRSESGGRVWVERAKRKGTKGR